MDYFREIAIELLPHVRRALADHGETPSTLMGRLAKECERLLNARQASLWLEQDANYAGKPALSGGGESTLEVDGVERAWKNEQWLTAGEETALEFLAEALARNPALIPAAIAEVAPGFYPTFLTYLVDVVFEAACPKTAGASLWWYMWRWFTASEPAAQLRERHPIVAGELAKTHSWAASIRTAEFGNRPGRVKGAARKWVDTLVEAVGGRAQDQNWQLVADVIIEDGPPKEKFVGLLKIELLTNPDLVRRLAEVSGAAVPFGHAFDIELQEIRASRAFRTVASDDNFNRYALRAAADMKLFGLAFSGGGIRSATFNLGVLQAFCRVGLFSRFDYLSTVSGGGFIGGWAIRHIKKYSGDVIKFERALADGSLKSSLTHLLRYRNYLLGPEANATSEAWKRGVLYAGGVMNNMVLMGAAVLSALLVSRIVVEMIGPARPPSVLSGWLLLPALAIATGTLPGAIPADEARPPSGWIRRRGAWAIGLATLVTTMGVIAAFAPVTEDAIPRAEMAVLWLSAVTGYITFVGLAILASSISRLRITMVAWSVVLAVLPAFILGALTAFLAGWLRNMSDVYPYVIGVVGAPLGGLVISMVLLFHLQIAGESLSEILREQLEELPPRLILLSGMWLLVAGAAMYAPVVIDSFLHASSATHALFVAMIVLVTLVLSMLLIRSRGGVLSLTLAGTLALLGGAVISYAAYRFLVAVGGASAVGNGGPSASVLGGESILVLLQVSGASLAALAILLLLFDVNRSALLRFYRGALARCFLYCPADQTMPASEDAPLHDASSYQRPFHIINATANAWSLISGTVPFTFSRLFCGVTGLSGTAPSYRPTATMSDGRLTLATALAISGAAVSPNARGFGGTLGFALGLANARLGAWVGNPAHASAWQEASPRLGGLYWFRELFGRKRSDAPYLYVTDGGHFENLGIYELVVRKCCVIVSIDAGCDQLWSFEDLANAVRRCSTDLSVQIDIDWTALTRHGGTGYTRRSWTMGSIHYPTGELGVLIYIKPSLSGDAPIDVMSYAWQHPDFPHQSTTDQFFDEAQFESYRRLGNHIGMGMISDQEVRQRLMSVAEPMLLRGSYWDQKDVASAGPLPKCRAVTGVVSSPPSEPD